MCSRKEKKPMSASKTRQPTLDSVAPRFLVGDMQQGLAFYGQLGFATPYHDEGFAIVERDRIALQFNVSDPTQEPPKEGCRVFYRRHQYRSVVSAICANWRSSVSDPGDVLGD